MSEDLQARVAAALEDNPNVKTLMLARQLGVSEVEALAAYPADLARELDAGRAEELIRALEALGRAHLVVNSGAAISENFGAFENFSNAGPFLNVSSDLHMHIMVGQLARVFAVTKPVDDPDKRNCSFQFFAADGRAAFKVFIHAMIPEPSKPLAEQVAEWERLTAEFTPQ